MVFGVVIKHEQGMKPVVQEHEREETSMNFNQDLEDQKDSSGRLPWETPTLEVASLQVVTLGGTPGADDTGAEFTQEPLSSGSSFSDEDGDEDEDRGPFG